MTLPFFGLGPKYRAVLYKEIYYLMKHIGGGLSHTEIWNLPIAVRHFYLKMASEDIKSENEAFEKTNKIKKPRMPNMPKSIRK